MTPARATQDIGREYRERILGVLADGGWHAPREMIRALGSPNREGARVATTGHLRVLRANGTIEGRGKTTARQYRLVQQPIAPALAAVHDLVARHPPSAAAPAHTPAPSASGEVAEGPGALEGRVLRSRLGTAVAAACRAFLAEWERP